MNLVLVSGISGSGKSLALQALEDFGFYCVDNIPLELLEHLIAWHRKAGGTDRLAVSIDARSKTQLKPLNRKLYQIKQAQDNIRILFLEAKDEILLQRYLETRRAHPLHDHFPLIKEAIAKERVLLEPIREVSLVLDTSYMHKRTLRQWIKEWVGVLSRPLIRIFQSCGFKFGAPSDANYVFDVRCLPNPHYSADLKELVGFDRKIQLYFEQFSEVKEMLKHIFSFLNTIISHYQENASLTIAIGCTGGIHRSVYITEKLAQCFKNQGNTVLVHHRQLIK